MRSGVYIGKAPEGNYDLVSMGDYINPITTIMKLRDSQKTLVKDLDLYLIIYDIAIEYVKVEVTGQMTLIRCFLSWDGMSWDRFIESEEEINALNQSTVVKPFKLRVTCDDFLDYFSIKKETIFNDYKLRLIYI